MTNHWENDSWQSSYDDELDDDAGEGEEHSDEWDDDDYEDFLAREFPDSTDRTDWAGGKPMWHITVWVVLAVFVGGFLLTLF